MAKILIVDDEYKLVELIAEIVSGLGHDVACFDDPLAALDELRVNDYDLVITDQIMPGLNGTELIEKIRKHRPMAAILSTGNDLSEKERTYLKRNHIEVISKPYKKADLHQAIENLANRGAI